MWRVRVDGRSLIADPVASPDPTKRLPFAASYASSRLVTCAAGLCSLQVSLRGFTAAPTAIPESHNPPSKLRRLLTTPDLYIQSGLFSTTST